MTRKALIVPTYTTKILRRLGELLSSQLAVLKSGSLQNLSSIELEQYEVRDSQIEQLLCSLPDHVWPEPLRVPRRVER
jgi:hypothetical protein